MKTAVSTAREKDPDFIEPPTPMVELRWTPELRKLTEGRLMADSRLPSILPARMCLVDPELPIAEERSGRPQRLVRMGYPSVKMTRFDYVQADAGNPVSR